MCAWDVHVGNFYNSGSRAMRCSPGPGADVQSGRAQVGVHDYVGHEIVHANFGRVALRFRSLPPGEGRGRSGAA